MNKTGAAEKSLLYWGWYVVASAFLVLSINYGARYGFGIFVKPLAEEFGWSRSVISFGASLNMLVYSLCAVFIGRIADQFAPRWLITAGALISSISFMIMGFVNTPFQFYIVYGLFTGTGTSLMGVVVSNTAVGKWFVKKRGLAIGITSMGISFGTLLFAPAAGYMVCNYRWQAGFFFLGAMTLLIGLTLSQTLLRRKRPEDYGLLPDNETNNITIISVDNDDCASASNFNYGKLFADIRFWTLGIAFGLTILTLMSAFVHLVAYAQDNGIDSIAAASSLGLIGITGFLGQFFFGWLSDHLKDAKYSAIIGLLIMIAGFFILMQADKVEILYCYALVYGFGYGSLAPMMPILAADRFGRNVLGSVYGMMTFLVGIGGSLGPIIGGLMYDRFGYYTYLWQADAAILVLVALLLLTLKPGHTSA